MKEFTREFARICNRICKNLIEFAREFASDFIEFIGINGKNLIEFVKILPERKKKMKKLREKIKAWKETKKEKMQLALNYLRYYQALNNVLSTIKRNYYWYADEVNKKYKVWNETKKRGSFYDYRKAVNIFDEYEFLCETLKHELDKKEIDFDYLKNEKDIKKNNHR